MSFFGSLANIDTFGLTNALGITGGSKNDPTSATNNGTFGPGGYQVGDIAYEGLAPNQNSVTQFERSFENAQAQTGQQQSQAGQGILGQGVAGLGKSNTDLQPAIDYFSKLLGGDTSTVQSALGPQLDQISQQFNQVRQMTSDLARGGGKASAESQQPFSQIQQISNLISGARSSAATGLNTAVGTEAGIDSTLGQLGLGESQLGFQSLQSAIQALESFKGLNIQQNGQNLNTATSILSSLI